MPTVGELVTRTWVYGDHEIRVEYERWVGDGEYLVWVDGDYKGYATTEALGKLWEELSK